MKITIKEIAKKANVSVSTVSNVINEKGKYSKETKTKVLKIIEDSDYRLNQAARILSNRKSNLVGLIILQKEEYLIENRFYQRIISSITSELSKKEYDLIVGDIKRNLELVSWCKKRNFEGLIIIGSTDMEMEKNLVELKIPIVFIDNYNDILRQGNEEYGNVISDNMLGGFEATELLVSRGCRKVAFVGDDENPTHIRRYLGYQAAISENSIEKNYIKLNSKVSFKEGKRIGKILSRQNIDGICVASDIIALGIMDELNRNNKKVPQEIKIIGFDNSDFCEYVSPELTSVELNFYEKGKIAVEVLFNQLEGKKQLKNISIDLNIIERKSV